MPRYLFKAAVASISIGSESTSLEMWFGLESDDPIDLAEYSREEGYDLVPCAGMTEEEVASCRVREWLRL
jgi:hypothetical protein